MILITMEPWKALVKGIETGKAGVVHIYEAGQLALIIEDYWQAEALFKQGLGMAVTLMSVPGILSVNARPDWVMSSCIPTSLMRLCHSMNPRLRRRYQFMVKSRFLLLMVAPVWPSAREKPEPMMKQTSYAAGLSVFTPIFCRMLIPSSLLPESVAKLINNFERSAT